MAVEADQPDNRLNDAHVDYAGRLWFGSMDNLEVQPTGALYRFGQDGLTRCDAGYVITNGPVVSLDGRTLYHVDTLRRLIYAYDLHDGKPTNRRVFVRIERPGAHPDGATIDAEGCLWVGLWGGWAVQRFSPTGTLLHTLELPVANCTKPAFGGPGLQTLYITTAWKGLTQAEREQQPLAGNLFAAPAPVAGVAAHEVDC